MAKKTLILDIFEEAAQQPPRPKNAKSWPNTHTWQYRGSNGKSVHLVQRSTSDVYTCTCPGFRIQKRGYCKHTQMAMKGVKSDAP